MASKLPGIRGKKPRAKVAAAKPKAAVPFAEVKAITPAKLPVVEAPALPPVVEALVAEPLAVTAIEAEAVNETVDVVADSVVETVAETVPAAEQIIEDTASQTAETAAQGKDIMEATIEKTQAMFADFNDRAKAQVEKSTKLVTEATEFAKGNVEALVESGKIAAKGFETLGQDVAEYNRRSFESATAALKSLSAIKSPADFFKLQSDYVRASFDSVVAETSKNTEAFIKLAGDAVQPISSRFAVAVEKVKTAA